MIAAIIPARGGSKRIPRKNIKPFFGRPILHYSVQAARESALFDRIICSTDDEEIAEVARTAGAETPFLRPETLADDFTPTAPVLLHAMDWLEQAGEHVDFFCCIYPLAPFIRPIDLRNGYELLREYDATSAVSVTSYGSCIFRSFKIAHDGRLNMFWPEYEMCRTNDLPDAYHDAAQFYWLNGPRFRKEQRLFSTNAIPIVLARHLVQDIDTKEDWETAERMWRALHMDKDITKAGEL